MNKTVQLSVHLTSLMIGLGLASILSKASSVTDSMVEASSLGLANSLNDEERASGLLYPRIERSEPFSVPCASMMFMFS